MCKYSNLKTSALDIYSIKPATISSIFSQGLNAPDEKEINTPQFEDSCVLENCKELTQTMNLFIFNDFKQEKISIEKQKVVEALQKIMKIQANLFKHSNDRETEELLEEKIIEGDFNINRNSLPQNIVKNTEKRQSIQRKTRLISES